MSPVAQNFAALISLIHRDELAQLLGYPAANNGFREFCIRNRITSVPGRRGWYDPQLVRRRLDEAQGLQGAREAASEALSNVERRRARRGAA